MEKEKIIDIGQGIKDINGEPKVRHSMAEVFAIMRDENGEEKEIDIRDIVGSKGKKEDK